MWVCKKCNEDIDDNFDSCWNCTDATMIEKEVEKEVGKEKEVIKDALSKDGEKHWNEFVQNEKRDIGNALKYGIGITIATIIGALISNC